MRRHVDRGMLSLVRLSFDPEDDRGFTEAADALVDRFTSWMVGEGRFSTGEIDEMAGDVGVALDWKFRYGDGEIGTWRTDDIAEFLLDWCPRKLSVTPADCVTIPVALASFFSFLDSQRLLADRSDGVGKLVGAVTSLSTEFVEAMGDRSRYGLAKSLFTAAVDEGVDPSDPDGIEAWMAGFNDRPDEERFRILPGAPESGLPSGLPSAPSAPPVVLPPDAEVAASAEAAPILGMFRDLAAYVGDGRKLTKKGNLTLADARELVARLGTGDEMDPKYGDRTYRTTSADNLYRLRQVVAWAKQAGMVRVVHGKLVATKRGLGLAGGLRDAFDRSLDALVAIGPLSSQRFHDRWLAQPELDGLLDEMSVHLLIGPYAALGPVPLEEVASLATEVVLDTFSFRFDDDEVERMVTRDVADILDAFELAGVARRTGTVEDRYGRHRAGGDIELTPAGVVAVRRLLSEAGIDTPVAGRLAGATAAELLAGIDLQDFPAAHAETVAWRGARTPVDAAAEMAAAIPEVTDPGLQNLGLAVLSEIGREVAAPHVRQLADVPATRGLALAWLVDQDMADERELFDPDHPESFVDVLAYRMVAEGPGALVPTLALVGDHGRQVEIVGRFWKAPSPATTLLLEAIARVHPTKVVAKAARKALFKRNSSFTGG